VSHLPCLPARKADLERSKRLTMKQFVKCLMHSSIVLESGRPDGNRRRPAWEFMPSIPPKASKLQRITE
jgi:hypothetical protein